MAQPTTAAFHRVTASVSMFVLAELGEYLQTRIPSSLRGKVGGGAARYAEPIELLCAPHKLCEIETKRGIMREPHQGIMVRQLFLDCSSIGDILLQLNTALGSKT